MVPGDGPADMSIRVESVDRVSPRGVQVSREQQFTFWREGDAEGVMLEHFDGMPLGFLSCGEGWSEARLRLLSGCDHAAVFRTLTEVFFRTALIRRREGLVLHAAGLVCDDEGYALVGKSGTGKSTQARMWESTRGAEVLNEDRPAVTLGPRGAMLHGTPWSGSSRRHRAVSVPLRTVILLEQAPYNRARSMVGGEALRRLWPQVFLPYWSVEGMQTGAEMVGRLLGAVPIVLLQCLPDAGGIVCVEELLSGRDSVSGGSPVAGGRSLVSSC